jgi:fructose-1,6-bisphosphatase I
MTTPTAPEVVQPRDSAPPRGAWAPGTPLADVLAHWAGSDPGRAVVADTVGRLAAATARISALVEEAPLRADELPEVREENASGDAQKPLDVAAEEIVLAALAGGAVAAVASEESEDPVPVTDGGSLVVTTDPVDGSGNIDINAPLGSIFSVLPMDGFEGDPGRALLQPGRAQLAAGFAVFGPSTVLVLTLGEGTDSYLLDRASGRYLLLHHGMTVAPDAQEYAINASNVRHWAPGIRSYVNDMVSGATGPRERDFNMRWLAALVAEAYRILLRGGIYLYPADARPGYGAGRLRLVYEANPVAMVFEQAGGAATDGLTQILDLVPTGHHQRVPLVFGSALKVERVRRYLTEVKPHDTSPLFGSRGLFRD